MDSEARPDPERSAEGHQVLTLRLWAARAFRQQRGRVIRRWQGQGETAASWWDWLADRTSIHHRVWVWAHNAYVDMTWLGLWAMIDAGELTLKSAILSHPPFIVDATYRGRSVTFLDSLNWFRCPLESMGKSLGLEKLPMPAIAAAPEDWFEYCRRDVNILADTVEQLQHQVVVGQLGQLRQTAPMQAWASWRHLHKGPFPLVHGDEDLSQHERDGYYGGLCRVFFRGHVRADTPPANERKQWEKTEGPTIWGQRVHVLDVRGFYPSIMRAKTFPWKHMRTYEGMPVETLGKVAVNYGVIARVQVDSPIECYPMRRERLTRHVRGCYWTTLAGPEVLRAIERGHIRKVGRTATYHLADLFSGWVDHLWALRERYREAGMASWEQLAKILSNALHGKLGQRSKNWKMDREHQCRERWGEWLECGPADELAAHFRGLGGTCQARQQEGEWAHACVAIPAYVTSWGRVEAREWMDVLPPQSLYYHDTDSLHVNDDGLKAIQATGWMGKADLGDLTIRGTHLHAEYRSQKVYRLDGLATVGGVPRARAEEEPWQWRYDRWESLRQILQRGPDGTLSVMSGLTVPVGMHLDGLVGADGWVSPPTVDDLTEPWA